MLWKHSSATNQHPRHGLCIQNRINGHITSEVHFSSGPTGDTAALMFLPGLFHVNCKKKKKKSNIYAWLAVITMCNFFYVNLKCGESEVFFKVLESLEKGHWKPRLLQFNSQSRLNFTYFAAFSTTAWIGHARMTRVSDVTVNRYLKMSVPKLE